MVRALLLATALFLLPSLVQAQPQAGDAYEIEMTRESRGSTTDGSSSSSHGRDTIIERVIEASEAGLVLEYDLPKRVPAQERAGKWQLPAKVFKPVDGPLQLLNEPELKERVDRWLETAELTREACGRWIFTWNAFQIECDPQSVLSMVEGLDIEPDELRDGALYRDPQAREPAPMKERVQADGTTLQVDVALDPEAVRRSRAESDVVVAEIMREPLTLEAALRARSADQVSGTITVIFDANAAGDVVRRTRVTKLKTKRRDGEIETETITETIERRLVVPLDS